MQVLEAEEAADQIRQNRKIIDAVESDVPSRDVTFQWTRPDGQPIERTYTQAELGMFPTQEFAQMVTEVIAKFTQGEMGMKIGDLFRGQIEVPSITDPDAVNKVIDENIALIQAFIELVRIVPDLQLDILCLSLGVGRAERAWAKEQMQEPPHRGGLTVDDGFDLLKVFIKQNAKLLRETYLGKTRELVETFRLEVLQEDPTKTDSSTEETPTIDQPDSLGSTPSSTSSPPTPASA